MRSTNAKHIVALAALVFAATGHAPAIAGDPPRLPAYGVDRIEGSTVAALQVAYEREMNARKDYEIFARVAERAGLPRVAKLFIAIASGESTHAAIHAANLGRFGVEPEWAPASVKIGTTAENLARSIETERNERLAVYRVYAEFARLECLYDASTGFTRAGGAEDTHADMFADALEELKLDGARPTLIANRTPVAVPAERTDPGPVAVVCPACGSAFHDRPARACPNCHGRSDAMSVFL